MQMLGEKYTPNAAQWNLFFIKILRQNPNLLPSTLTSILFVNMAVYKMKL